MSDRLSESLSGLSDTKSEYMSVGVIWTQCQIPRKPWVAGDTDLRKTGAAGFRWMTGWMGYPPIPSNPIQSHCFIIFPTIWSIPFLDQKKIFTASSHRGTGRIKQTENHQNIPNCILCMKTNTSCRIPASLIVMDVIHSCSCARLMLIVTIFFVGRSGVPQFDGWSSFSTLRLPYIYIKSYKRIYIYIYIYIYHNHWYPHHIPIFSSLNHRSSWIHRKRPPQIWLDKCCIAWGSGHGMSCPGSEKHGISCGISWG